MSYEVRTVSGDDYNEVTMKADTTRGVVYWMDKWEEWPKLKRDGHIRAEYGGTNTYGHITLIFAD